MSGNALPAPPPLSALTNPALFLDFDGTLVSIAAEPGAISVPDGLGARIEALAARHRGRVAVVTGRALGDLERHLGPVELHRAGSHGAHVLDPDGKELRAAGAVPAAAKDTLREYARDNGLFYEDKTHGAGLHSRAVPEKFAAMSEFAASVAAAHGLDCKRGKQVIELVRPGADKAGAVRLLMDRPLFAGTLPVFIGDDVTDEDGFAACMESGGFGIAVGERASEHARYRLDGVDEVYEWLEL